MAEVTQSAELDTSSTNCFIGHVYMKIRLTHRLNRHSRTMERKWEQRILPPIPLKLCTKHGLGQTESMSQMQMSITVRIGEGDNKFLLLAPIIIVAWVTLKGLFTFPHGLNFHLGGTQSIALGGSLGSGADGEIRHLGGRRSGWCHFTQYILDVDATLSLAAMNVSGGNLLPA